MRETEAEAGELKQALDVVGEELKASRGDIEDLCIMQEAADRGMAKAQARTPALCSLLRQGTLSLCPRAAVGASDRRLLMLPAGPDGMAGSRQGGGQQGSGGP